MRKLALIGLGVLACVASRARGAEVGDVIINEIMINPLNVSDLNGEWIELFNTTDYAINLDGWTIRDLDFDEHVLDPGMTAATGSLIIPARGFVVLGINDNPAFNGGVPVDYEYFASDFRLDDNVDEVILEDPNNVEIDRVLYGDLDGIEDGDPGENFPSPNGASIAFTGTLINGLAHYRNDFGENWIPSLTSLPQGDFGTPGLVNNLQIFEEPVVIAHDFTPFSPPALTNLLGIQDRGVAVYMRNTVTVASLGIMLDLGNATTLAVSIREITFDNIGNELLGPVLETASIAVAAETFALFYDVPIDFTFLAGHFYDIAFNVPGGWGNPSVHQMEYFEFDNPTLDPDLGFEAGAFLVLDGRGFAINYDNTFLPHTRAGVKTVCEDLAPPDLSPQLRSDLGDNDRGVAVLMDRTVRTASLGIAGDIVTTTELTVTIRSLVGGVPGATILAQERAPVIPAGPAFYDVPIDFTFQAGVAYQIGFNIRDGWGGADSIHELDLFPFNNSGLGLAGAFDSGAFVVLDGFGGTQGFGDPLLPHIRACEVPACEDLGHPTFAPQLQTGLGAQDRGVAIDVTQTVSISSVAAFVDINLPTVLTATIREVSGTTLGPIVAVASRYVLPGPTQFVDVPIRFTFFEDRRYDIAFNVTNGWGAGASFGMQLYAFDNSTLNPASGFVSGPFIVLDGRGGASGYGNTFLPRIQVCVLNPGDDLQPPFTNFNITDQIGGGARGVAFEVTERTTIESAGIFWDPNDEVVLTVEIREVIGTTLQPVLASSSITIDSDDRGPAFYDVPINFTFEPDDVFDIPRRWDVAFNIVGGWGFGIHEMPLYEFNNATLNRANGYEIGRYLVLDGRGTPGDYTNTVMPRIRLGHATPLALNPVEVIDFAEDGTQLGDWIGGVQAGAASTSVTASGLCMTVPGPGDNIAAWVSPERLIELIDNTAYRLRTNVTTTQMGVDAIPLFNIAHDNFNSSGLGNNFGGVSWFLDVAGGAAGIGRPNGRDLFDVYIVPNAVLLPQWRGIINFDQSAFSPAADFINDIRVIYRVLDANDSLLTGADSGTICINRLEIDTVDLDSLETEAIVFNPPINTALYFPETAEQALVGSTPVINNATATVRYALFSPDDRSTLGPFDPTQPNLNSQLFPIIWEENGLFRGQVKLRSDVNNGFGTIEGLDPVDAILLLFDTATNELGQFTFTTRGSAGNMFRAASPRLPTTVNFEPQTYIAFFYTHNVTDSAVPDANRFRLMADFFNASNLFGGSGTDPFIVEAVTVTQMKTPEIPN